jgi:hypothetical protein
MDSKTIVEYKPSQSLFLNQRLEIYAFLDANFLLTKASSLSAKERTAIISSKINLASRCPQ